MGYSEVYCHICGVSFNVARSRTEKERRSAAWRTWGPITAAGLFEDHRDEYENYVALHTYKGRTYSDCGPETGCKVVVRKSRETGSGHVTADVALGEDCARDDPVTDDVDDEDEDETWNSYCDTEDEDEPLEYCSDEDVLNGMSENEEQFSDVENAYEEKRDREAIREFWTIGMRGCPRPPFCTATDHLEDVGDQMMPLSLATEESMDKNGHGMSSLGEHIAGLGCKSRMSYNGHEIGVEEMRHCHTVQCLVRKPPGQDFQPELDDEDFERTGEFFLSGLGDHMPSRDSGIPSFKPVRHGCDEAQGENCMYISENAYECAMPFHPSCFEIYKRASLSRNGRVDVTSLTSWWALEAAGEHFYNFPRDPNVLACRQQDWEHERGTSYLVANPLYVPRLKNIFESVVATSEDFNPTAAAFVSFEDTSPAPSHDPFTSLPHELLVEILDVLSSKDIAALRLSSRALSHLPISYFQKLLLREMPWLWEVCPKNAQVRIMPYSKWATTTAAELEAQYLRHEHKIDALKEYISTVKEEMPELTEQLDAAYPAELQALQDELLRGTANKFVDKPFFLPPDKTDYFKLYTLITRHWADLKGLQNRRRIWKDCEEILRRANKYREEGRMDDKGVVGSLHDIIRLRQEKEMRRREEWERNRQMQRLELDRQRAQKLLAGSTST